MGGFTCTLKISTRYKPAELFEMLRSNLPFVTGVGDPDPRFPRTLFTTQEALQIDVGEAINPAIQEEMYGFHPTVTVHFELDKDLNDDRYDVGQSNVMRGLDWLVNHIEGDMVYLVNYATPALLRRGREIWLDRKDTYWGERLPLLTFPYEWKKLS